MTKLKMKVEIEVEDTQEFLRLVSALRENGFVVGDSMRSCKKPEINPYDESNLKFEYDNKKFKPCKNEFGTMGLTF